MARRRFFLPYNVPTGPWGPGAAYAIEKDLEYIFNQAQAFGGLPVPAVGDLLVCVEPATWSAFPISNTVQRVLTNSGIGPTGGIVPAWSQIETSGLADHSVTLAKLQEIATQRVLGRSTAGTGDVELVTITQILDWISTTRGVVLFRGAAGWQALAPSSDGDVLTTHGAGADPTWEPVSAAGDVVGPASSVDGEIVLFDGVTGKLIKAAAGTGIVTAVAGVYTVVSTVPADPHDLLSATHPDTIPASPVLGDIIVAIGSDAVEVGGFWFEGLPIDSLPTDAPVGEQAFWFDGLPIGPLLGAGTPKWARKATGSAGDVLTADGAGGVSWQPSGGGGATGATVARTTNLSVAIDTSTPVPLDAVEFDSSSFWSAGAPTRLTVPAGKGGTYLAIGQVSWNNGGATRNFSSRILVNGTERAAMTMLSSNTTAIYNPQQVSRALVLNVGDYVELAAYFAEVGGPFDVVGGTNRTFLQLVKVG